MVFVLLEEIQMCFAQRIFHIEYHTNIYCSEFELLSTNKAEVTFQ